MSVRAKFKVDSIEVINQPKSMAAIGSDGSKSYVSVPGTVTTLKLSPVYANGDPNHENSKFWAASPGGSLALNCVNPEAVKLFEVGKEYYIDFTPAES